MAGSPLNDFPLKPALRVQGNPERLIRTLDEALEFVRTTTSARREKQRSGLLRRLEAAVTTQAMEEAGHAFRAWLEQEHLLIEAVD